MTSIDDGDMSFGLHSGAPPAIWHSAIMLRTWSMDPLDTSVSVENLAAVLDGIRMFVALIVPGGTIVWVNRTAQALARRPAQELVNTRVQDAPWWFSSPTAETLANAVVQAATGEVVRGEFDLRGPDDRPLRFDMTLRLLPIQTGNKGTILIKGIDVTETRQRDRQREIEDAIYRAVVDTHTDVICRTAPDGTVLFVNDAYCNLFGRARKVLVGRAWQPGASPEDTLAMTRALGGMTAEHPVMTAESRIIDGEGQVRWMEFVSRGFYDREDHLLEVQSIGRDITLRREGEAERQRAERRMQERQRIEGLGLLAAGVAHDINNILTCIITGVELARCEESSLQRSTLLDEVDAAAGRAAALCRQMLAYAGRSPLAPGRVDLKQLITSSQPLLRASLPRGSALRLHLADDLPALMGDETQLRQIVLNLVTNAGEAVREHGGLITVSVRGSRVDHGLLDGVGLDVELPDGEVIVLAVTDNGIGMPPEILTRIFEPFFTTKSLGRGLGLAATRGLLRAHHAAVQVDSVPGAGTRFEIVFPVAAPRVNVAPPLSDIGASVRAHSHGLILLVDDDDAVRTLLARQLRGLGYEILQADGGHEAVAMFREHAARVHVVLLDLTMPDLDGDAVMRELQRVRPGVPGIIMSGCITGDVDRLFAGTCVIGFLEKPFSLAALQSLLVQVVGAP